MPRSFLALGGSSGLYISLYVFDACDKIVYNLLE